MAIVRRVTGPLDLAPLGRIDLGKVGVAIDLRVDLGEVDAVGARQEFFEYPRAAKDDHLRRRTGEIQRLIRRARDKGAVAAKVPVARHHDARAAGKRTPAGVPGAATHDEMLPD